MTKRLFNSDSEYRTAARSLRDFLGHGFKLDNRKKLTRTDKAYITRQYKRFKPESLSAKRYKDIKGYLNEDMQKAFSAPKLNNYRKMQLRDYHKTIRQLKKRRHIEYKSKDQTRLATAQKFAQHPGSLKGINTAFIPYTSQDKPRVSFNKNGDLILNTKFERSKVIVFDEFELENREGEYIQELVDDNPAFDIFTIHAGNHFISQAQSRDLVADKIESLMNEYSDKEKHNFYGNWLGGMTGRKMKKQKSKAAMKKALAKAKAKKKAKTNAKRKKR